MSVTTRVREVTGAEKLFVAVIVVKFYSLYHELLLCLLLQGPVESSKMSCDHVNKHGTLLIPMLPKTAERNVGRRVICALLGKALQMCVVGDVRSHRALDNILPSLSNTITWQFDQSISTVQ